jgi:predicted GNAT family acetyltransferase
VDRHEEDKLDETLTETFPASDAPANTVETGIGAGGADESAEVSDNQALSRFELAIDGETAYLRYQRNADSLVLLHTEVPPPLRGRHLGEKLVDTALDAARSRGLRSVVECPFAVAYLRRHPRRGK